jgi:hypothetical protein
MTATQSAGSPPRTAPRRVRRNRITERDLTVVTAISVLSALGAALADARPTAWRPADVVITALLGGLVAWAGASAPWWALAVASGVATLVAPGPGWIVAGVVAFVVSVCVGARRVSFPVGRAAAAGAVVNVLLRWDGPDVFAVTAVVTGAIFVLILATGLARRGRAARRVVRRALVLTAIVIGVAVVGAAIAMAQAYGDLRDGEAALRSAASALRSGDVTTASEELERSASLLARASSALDRPWARPALAVPLLAQHIDAVADLARGAESLTIQAAASVAQIDVESLRVIDGVIDVAAIEVLETPFAATNESLRRLGAVVDEARSPWLVAPLGRRLSELQVEVEDLVTETGRALDVVRLAPSMLGSEGPRTYFVAFTTPAEVRGLGGFMGTWAELRADDGRLEVVRTGLTQDLTGAMGDDPPVLEGPADYLARYGRFGAGLDGAPVAIDFWSNYTMSPNFPSITEVVAQLYPRSGGRPIDGAIAVDVDAVARFLQLIGPITVQSPAGAIRVDAANARDYLLRDQYADITDDAVRDAVLEQLTTELVNGVFGGSLPGPRILADTVGPALADGRIVVWSLDADDQTLLRELGIAGELPAPSPDGLAVVSTNAGANKLDAYLQRTITYDAVLDEPTGELRATATITLASDAPDDLPTDVGGNPFGLPPGTNRQYLSVYSPWQFGLAEVDGQPTGMEVERELGWNVYSTYVDIPAGEEVEVRLGFAGTLPEDADYGLTLRAPPLAVSDVVRVAVTTTDGEVLLESHQPRIGVDMLVPGASEE